MGEDERDRVALWLTAIVGLFIVGSLAALIIAAFQGAQGGEEVWAGLFSLMTAILGAIGGYLVGKSTGQGPGEEDSSD